MKTISFTKLNSEENDYDEPPFDLSSPQKISLFGKPKEIGHFSIDSCRSINFDRSSMKYLYLPRKLTGLKLDLNENLDADVVRKYVTLEKMHQALYWLMFHKQNLETKHLQYNVKRQKVDFVTVRGTMTRVMCTPYCLNTYRSQWEICASKFNGTIYFSAIDSDTDIVEEDTISIHRYLCQRWGYKFEQHVTSGELNGKPDLTTNTHQLEEFCIILKNVFNDHTLLYNAEIDAAIPHRFPYPGQGDTTCYTEIKTAQYTYNKDMLDVFKDYFRKHKMIQWWSQSYICGIPEVICGRRTKDGIVREIDVSYVSDFQKESLGHWSPELCLSFCDKFLTFLKKNVVEDPSTVYKFLYKGDGVIHCTKLQNSEPRYMVLPSWYIQEMK